MIMIIIMLNHPLLVGSILGQRKKIYKFYGTIMTMLIEDQSHCLFSQVIHQDKKFAKQTHQNLHLQ